MTTAQLENQPPTLDSDALTSLPDHRGQPRHKPCEFIVPPPAEIGPVSSAESTLAPGRRPKPMLLRLVIGTLIAGAIYWVFSYLSEGVRSRDRSVILGLGVAVAIGGFALEMYLTRFLHYFTYVGRDGAARITLRGHRDAIPKTQLLLFPGAAELHAQQTRQFVNGVYTGTTYNYSWTGPDGRTQLRLRGTYRGKNAPPKPGDPFHFATATEIAWSIHYLDRAQDELDKNGSIRFNVDNRRSLQVGPGFLEFNFGGETPVRVTRDEIASVSLGSGQFSFKHKDARWYSRSGKYNFRYGTMANARVFLLALDKLMGYRWT